MRNAECGKLKQRTVKDMGHILNIKYLRKGAKRTEAIEFGRRNAECGNEREECGIKN